MSSIQILVGCDPELFLKDASGKFVSAHTLLPGTKIEPYKVPRGAIQVDGVAAEFNIDPASSAAGFVTNIQTVMTMLRSRIGTHQLVTEPFAVFEPSYFSTLPPETRELGCNPDFNAWTGQVNPAPDGEKTTMRTASGHVHIGWCKDVNPFGKAHQEDCRMVVKQLDYYLGMYSLLWDPDNTRRQLYGKAGAFRPKPYGCEYRVLSNQWLTNENLMSWVWQATYQGVRSLLDGKKSMEEQYGSFAQEVIDGNKTDWIDSSNGQEILRQSMLPFLTPEFYKGREHLIEATYKKKRATTSKAVWPREIEA